MRLQAGDGDGHEGEEEDEKSEEGSETAWRVEGYGVVDGCDAEETEGKQEDGPDDPASPEIAKGNEDEREEEGGEAVNVGVDGAEDVTAVELAGGEKVERSGEEADPGGAANRMEK